MPEMVHSCTIPSVSNNMHVVLSPEESSTEQENMPLHVTTSLQIAEELLSVFREEMLEEVRAEIRETLIKQEIRAIEREEERERRTIEREEQKDNRAIEREKELTSKRDEQLMELIRTTQELKEAQLEAAAAAQEEKKPKKRKGFWSWLSGE